MNKRVKISLALFLALAVLFQYSFSPQALFAYGLNNTDKAVQTEETATDGGQPADKQEATDPAEEPAAEPTEPSTEPAAEPTKPAAEDEQKDEDTEEVKYPAQTFSESAGGVSVAVSAPEGALPEGATMKVEAVKSSEVDKAVEELIDNGTVVKAVDITFYDKEGKEIEPNKNVSVNMTSVAFKGLEAPAVVHIKDNGDAEKVDNGTVTGSKATFRSDDFSIYVVVENENPDPDARLEVNFYEADGTTLIRTMSLTKNQLDAGQMNVNIYDPGVEGLGDGEVFKGWTEKKNYTVRDAENGLTIADIRGKVRTLLNTGSVQEGDKINLYAMVFESYHISYLDELAVTIYTDEVLYKAGDTEVPYTVQFAYTPYYVTGSDESDETKAANFDGWKQMDPETATPAPVYDNGETINMADKGLTTEKNTLVLMAQVAYGHWLVFNENASGASYTPPLFVGTDQTPAQAGMPDPPSRQGYTFDGWYMNDECTTPFVPSQQITETTTVYAKWKVNTETSFSVLIWEESLGDGTSYEGKKYNFVRSIEIDNARTGIRMDSVVRGNVGDSTIKVNGEDVFIPLLSVKPTDPDYGKACKGFTYRGNSGNNQGIVVANGTSVLNVYFDRREYTLKFYYGAQVGTGNNSWRIAHNSNTGPYTWSQPSGFTPEYTAGKLSTGSDNTGDGKVAGGTYRYAAIKAKYGEEIGDKWPGYGDFTEGTSGNNHLNSWILMPGAKARTGQYGGDITVKGKITIMDEQVLGNLASEDGNYLVAQYNNTAYDYTYSIYFRDPQGTRTYNGNKYSLHESINVRSGSDYANQHEPSYRGYSYVGREDHPAGTTGRTIYFYYDPVKYPILFKDGLYVDGSGNTIKNNNTNELYSLQDDKAITYKQSVEEYNEFDPTELIGPDGKKYVFLGWYSDDTCSEKYTFTTMPEGGITVYAKWVLKEYKVTLHPNENGDTSFKYRNGNPAGHYGPYGDVIYVDNGEKIGDVGGTRDLYDLIGWFTNENRSRVWDFSAFEMNDEMVLKYDGDIYATDGSDPRYNPQYPGTIGEIDLYASWRRILDGADGINITYTAIGLNDKGETVEGTGAPTDINEYSDQAQAIARPACQPPEAGQGEVQQAFQYWVVQRWDKTTGAYVDTDQHVYPGDRYWVNFDDAKEEDWVDPENPKKTKKYTVQLRAQYGAAEYAPPTHIYWYDNFTDSEDGIIHRDEPLDINQAVDVQPAPSSREGYDFIGWGKESEVKSDGTPIYTYDLGEDDLFLVYDSDSGTYTYTPSGTTESKPAEQVFADETKPYDGLYAVWREQTVKIEYKVASDSTGRGTVSLPEEVVPVITGEPAGSTAIASSTDYVLGYWTCDDGTEHISSAAHFTPSKNDDGFYEAHTYYAHFVEAKATVTVEHYLKGETTPFDTDVVENLDIGSTYTATPKTALQGKTLTVDSKDPESGSITVSASNNLIKIYYTLPLTITAKDKTYTYNGEAQGPAGTYTSGFDTYVTVEGLLSDDALTSITLSGKETNQGTYTDEIVPSDAAVGNKSYYVVTYVEADLTIKKAELTITAKPLIYTYNGEAQGPAGTYTSGFDTYVIVSGLQGSDKLTSITLSGKKTNQGTYTNEIEPSDAAVGENTGNYDIKYVKADLTIKKAELTITAKPQTYTYNGEAQGPAGTYTSGFDTYVTVVGLQGSDKLTSITLSGKKTNQGTYTNEIEPSAAAVGENTDNYDIKYVKADLTINKAVLTITAIAKTYTYNGEAQGPAGTHTSNFNEYVTVSGLQGSDKLTSITLSGSKTNAGEYKNEIEPSAAAVGENTGNYEINYVKADLTIDAATLTITAIAKTYTYNGGAQGPAGTHTSNFDEYVTVSGLQGSDALTSITLSGSKTNVGEYKNEIEPTAAEIGNNTGNYNITFVKADLTINTAVLTITAKPQTYTYNASPQGPAGTYTSGFDTYVTVGGLQGSDKLTSITMSGKQTNAGIYPNEIEPSAAAVGDNTANYEINYIRADLTINKGKFTVTAVVYNQPYDGETHNGGATPSVTEGTTIQYSTDGGTTWTGTVPSIKNVGEVNYMVKATNSNYEDATDEGKLTVTPKAVTVTANNAGKTYDNNPNNPESYTASVTGLVGSDTIAYTVSRKAGEDVGTYAITATGNKVQGNYTVTYVPGTFSISLKEVTVIPNDTGKTYDNNPNNPANYTASVTGLVGSDTITYDVVREIAGEDVGKYPIKATGNEIQGNYHVTYLGGTFTISPKAVTVTITGQTGSQKYDGNEYTVEGYDVAIGDPLYQESDIEFTGDASASRTDAGTSTMSLVGKFSNKNKNFKVTFNVTDGSITITKRNIKIVSASGKKVYDGKALTKNNPSTDLRITGDGFVTGEAPSIVITGSQTKVGRSDNTFTMMFKDSAAAAMGGVARAKIESNYNITVVYGKLVVTRGSTPTPGGGGTNPGGGNPAGGGGNPGVAAAPAPAPPTVINDPNPPTTIIGDPTPKAVPEYWALINLLCAIATALLSLIMLIRFFGRKKEEDEETGEETKTQRRGLARIASLIPAIGGIIAFILTEDMSNPMTMVDKWTLLMIVILAIQIGVAVVAKLRDDDEEDDEEEEAMA